MSWAVAKGPPDDVCVRSELTCSAEVIRARTLFFMRLRDTEGPEVTARRCRASPGPGADRTRHCFNWTNHVGRSGGQPSSIELLSEICFFKSWGAGEPQGLLGSPLCRLLILHGGVKPREVMFLSLRARAVL